MTMTSPVPDPFASCDGAARCRSAAAVKRLTGRHFLQSPVRVGQLRALWSLEGLLICRRCRRWLPSQARTAPVCTCFCAELRCHVPACGFVPLSYGPVPVTVVLTCKDRLAARQAVNAPRQVELDGVIVVNGHHRLAGLPQATVVNVVDATGTAQEQLLWHRSVVATRPMCAAADRAAADRAVADEVAYVCCPAG